LIRDRCEDKQAIFSRETGIDATYVSRLLNPKGKPGDKNLGEDLIDVIRQRWPDLARDWFDVQPGSQRGGKGKFYVIENGGLTPDLANIAKRVAKLDRHWRAAVESIIAIGESASDAVTRAQKPRKQR
jgi:hypothetical protein